MDERRSIKTKQGRILYFPLALIQWAFYTILFGGLGLCTIVPIGIVYGVGNLIMLDKEEAKQCFMMAATPFVLTVMWWRDYVTKGEIGHYE